MPGHSTLAAEASPALIAASSIAAASSAISPVARSPFRPNEVSLPTGRILTTTGADGERVSQPSGHPVDLEQVGPQLLIR